MSLISTTFNRLSVTDEDHYDDIDALFPESPYVEEVTALRNTLLKRSKAEPIPIFYYCALDDKTMNQILIKRYLKMQPEGLPYSTWKQLTSVPLSFTWRSPEQERRHRVAKASPDTTRTTRFAAGLARELEAAVGRSAELSRFGVEFVEPQDVGIDVVLERGVFKIDGRWKEFEFAHASAKWCETYLLRVKGGREGGFRCVHAVAYLCGKMMEELCCQRPRLVSSGQDAPNMAGVGQVCMTSVRSRGQRVRNDVVSFKRPASGAQTGLAYRVSKRKWDDR